MTQELQSPGKTSFSIGPFKYDGRNVRAHLAITKEDDHSFSVIVLNLPGCGSCGDSEEEAISNVREAVKGVVDSYQEDGEEVPWVDCMVDDDIPSGAKLKWIMVNV